MAQHLRSNPVYLRSCILYEVLSNKPIFECYKNFCKKLGEDAMSYEEFHFWFMKFSRGEMDLEYDRSRDPKTRTFFQLPVKVLDVIVQNVSPTDVLTLRQVSKDLKNAMDQIQVYYNSALLRIRHEGITLEVNGKKIIEEYKNLWAEHEPWNTGADEWHYSQNIEKMYPYLKYPNIHFKHFNLEALHSLRQPIVYGTENWIHEKFMKFLETIGHHVTFVKLLQNENDLEILEALKPGTLREIHLARNEINDTQLFYNAIVKTEHWRQTKVFRCDGDMEYAKIEDFGHFEDFQIRNWPQKDEELERLVDIIRTNPKFRRCRLMRSRTNQYGLFTSEELLHFEFALGRTIQKLPSETTYLRYLWKDGEREFEIGMCDEVIDIERKD